MAVNFHFAFTPDDSIRDLLGFKPKAVNDEYNTSDYPVDIIPFDKFFLDYDIAQGLIFTGKRSRIVFNWTMAVDRGFEYVEIFRGGIIWYMMESNDFSSKRNFKLKNVKGGLVSFNGQSITFGLSIKEV